jgi:hypothetical protein
MQLLIDALKNLNEDSEVLEMKSNAGKAENWLTDEHPNMSQSLFKKIDTVLDLCDEILVSQRGTINHMAWDELRKAGKTQSVVISIAHGGEDSAYVRMANFTIAFDCGY